MLCAGNGTGKELRSIKVGNYLTRQMLSLNTAKAISINTQRSIPNGVFMPCSGTSCHYTSTKYYLILRICDTRNALLYIGYIILSHSQFLICIIWKTYRLCRLLSTVNIRYQIFINLFSLKCLINK